MVGQDWPPPVPAKLVSGLLKIKPDLPLPGLAGEGRAPARKTFWPVGRGSYDVNQFIFEIAQIAILHPSMDQGA